jgi:hypothetical protein
MARIVERVFDPSKPLIVRRFFAGAGRHWNPGDEFPWRRLAIDTRRVRLMFEAGKLMHPVGYAAPVVEVGAVGAVLTPPPSIAQEMQDEDIYHTSATSTPLDDAVVLSDDGLDDLGMKDLRAIAEAEGAPTRVSRADQREAIREHRRASAAG